MIDRDLLVFELAQQRYALPVARVREVLPRVSLTSIPEAPATVAGVLRLRGALLPVVDLRRRLGLPSVEPEIGHRIVIALVAGDPIGVLVDEVEGLASVGAHEARLAARSDHLVQGVIETPGRVVTILNPDIVGSEALAWLAAVGPGSPRPAVAALVGDAERGQPQ